MSYTALLVEDNYTIRRLYARTLERNGLEVVAVETLHEARAALAENPIDVVVCDFQLTDGIATDFMAELHAADVPVVAMSADDDYRRTSDALGMEAFLHKPIPTRILTPTVREAIHTVRRTALA